MSLTLVVGYHAVPLHQNVLIMDDNKYQQKIVQDHNMDIIAHQNMQFS